MQMEKCTAYQAANILDTRYKLGLIENKPTQSQATTHKNNKIIVEKFERDFKALENKLCHYSRLFHSISQNPPTKPEEMTPTFGVYLSEHGYLQHILDALLTADINERILIKTDIEKFLNRLEAVFH
jgi:hypothetical protein